MVNDFGKHFYSTLITPLISIFTIGEVPEVYELDTLVFEKPMV